MSLLALAFLVYELSECSLAEKTMTRAEMATMAIMGLMLTHRLSKLNQHSRAS